MIMFHFSPPKNYATVDFDRAEPRCHLGTYLDRVEGGAQLERAGVRFGFQLFFQPAPPYPRCLLFPRAHPPIHVLVFQVLCIYFVSAEKRFLSGFHGRKS